MAGVDTRNKRFSMLGLGLDFGRVRPNPDGTIGTPDRLGFLPLYDGIAASAPSTSTEGGPNHIYPSRPVWRRWRLMFKQR